MQWPEFYSYEVNTESRSLVTKIWGEMKNREWFILGISFQDDESFLNVGSGGSFLCEDTRNLEGVLTEKDDLYGTELCLDKDVILKWKASKQGLWV